MKENTKGIVFHYPHKTKDGYIVSYATDQVIDTVEKDDETFDVYLSDFVFDAMIIEIMSKACFTKNKETNIDELLKSIDDLKFSMFSARHEKENYLERFQETQTRIELKSKETTKKYLDFMKELSNE